MSEHQELPSGSSQADKRALLARFLAARARAEASAATRSHAAPAASDRPAIVVLSRDGELPLSYAQQRLWFAEQLAPGTWTYHIPIALRLRGPLDAAALDASLTEIVS